MQLIKFHNDLNLARTASMHVRLQDAYVLEMKKNIPDEKKTLLCTQYVRRFGFWTNSIKHFL